MVNLSFFNALYIAFTASFSLPRSFASGLPLYNEILAPVLCHFKIFSVTDLAYAIFVTVLMPIIFILGCLSAIISVTPSSTSLGAFSGKPIIISVSNQIFVCAFIPTDANKISVV